MPDNLVGIHPRIQNDDGLHAIGPDHRRIANARQTIEHSLDILWKNVEPFGRHDHFFLAAQNRELPVFLKDANVAGVEPTVFEGLGRFFGALVIAGSNVRPAHQDLAVVRNLHLDAADRFSDGAFFRVERMVERNDGRGFRKPIALDHEKTELGEKCLETGRQRRRAHDEAPELPTEQAVYFAVSPPAAHPVHAGRLHVFQIRERLQQILAQNLEDLRHRNQHRDPARANLSHDFLGIEAAYESDDARQHGRDKRRHGLSEHVAER